MKCELISKTVGVGAYSSLNQEELIAAVARHGTIKEDNGKLVKYLMDNKHWSPLQHISFGFRITTSRAISAQAFRHKSLEFQEFSQRYSEVPGHEEIELRAQHKSNRQSSTNSINPVFVFDGVDSTAKKHIEYYLQQGKLLYQELINSGVAKECARMILPMSSTTEIHITGNLRNLLGFLNVRCDKHAQLEIQEIATSIGEYIEKELPIMMGSIDWRNGMFM